MNRKLMDNLHYREDLEKHLKKFDVKIEDFEAAYRKETCEKEMYVPHATNRKKVIVGPVHYYLKGFEFSHSIKENEKTQRPPKVIKKKVVEPFYSALLNGSKTFEIRVEDGDDYRTGDTFVAVLWDVEKKEYICNEDFPEIRKRIGFLTNYSQKPNHVVFSLLDIEKAQTVAQV